MTEKTAVPSAPQIVSLMPADPGWRIARVREAIVDELSSPLTPADLAEWVRDAALDDLYEIVPVAGFALVDVGDSQNIETVVRGTYMDGTHGELHPAYGLGAIAVLGPGQFVEDVLVGEEAEGMARHIVFSELTGWLFCDEHEDEISAARELLHASE